MPNMPRHIQNVDRLLTSQPVFSHMFAGSSDEFFRSLEALIFSVLPVTSIEEKWDIVLKEGTSYATFGSDLGTLYFWQFLIRLGRLKTVLELGTYVGVSALFLAEAVGENGQVTTVELGKEFSGIAAENFRRNAVGKRIKLVQGGALETVTRYAAEGKKFDMVIIDAAKQSYGEMLRPGFDCLSPHGLLMVDDVFFHGDTLNQNPASDKGQGVSNLLKQVAELPATYHKVILPIDDGLLLIQAARG
jgi:predicted O-methyltransferase YrrM